MDVIAGIRRALVSLLRSWGVAAVVVLTLAVGIAMLTTVFSFVNSAAFRPLPYPGSDRTFALSAESRDRPRRFSELPLHAVRELRATARSFEAVAAFREGNATLSGSGDAVHVGMTEVDPAVFPMLHARVQLGRLPSTDQVHDGEPVVVLSQRLWKQQFGGADNVVGQVVRIDGAPHTIVGVMEGDFRFYERSDIWRPLVESDASPGPLPSPAYSMIGRLHEDVSLADARTEVGLIGRRLVAAGVVQLDGWSLVIRDGMVERGTRVLRPFALLLAGAGAFVLFIASANVVNLLLVRAAARRGEVAIRSALGATRGQLIRQAMAESLVLAVAACAMGTVLATWSIGLITRLVPLSGVPSWVRFGVDLRVLAFSAVVSLITLLLVGLVTALEGTRVNVASVLKNGSNGGATGRRDSRRASALAVGELALATILCVGATTISRTFLTLVSLDPGYEPERVLAVGVPFARERYPDVAGQRAFYDAVRERLEGHPAVAGMALRASLSGFTGQVGSVGAPTLPDHRIFLPDERHSPATAGLDPAVSLDVVSDSFFSVLGIELLRGRTFSPRDDAGGGMVVIVSDRLARHIWRGGDPIGQVLRVGADGPMATVIGVVASRRDPTFGPRGLGTAPLPAAYFSDRQAAGGSPSLLVRAAADPDVLRPAVLWALHATDPDQAAGSVQTVAAEMEIVAVVIRAVAAVFIAFTSCAFILGLMGIYSVVAEGVAQRTREIGIRMALGATRGDILREVAGRGLRLTCLGLAIGLPAAWLSSRAVGAIFYGIVPVDAGTYVGVALGFGAVTLAATYHPAHRATRVDPASAIRDL